MHLPMLFKQSKQKKNHGLHMHVILFFHPIQDGRLVAILLLERVPNHFSDMHGLILLKLGKSTADDGIHLHVTLFCDLIKDGRLVDWWPLLLFINMGYPFNSVQQNY